MFNKRTGDFWEEYTGDVHVGDLVELKDGVMLVEPRGPVLVLKADNKKGLYEIMYTSTPYFIGCGRLEIRKVLK